MKKYAVIALMLLGVSQSLRAQDTDGKGFMMGLRFLPTFTQFQVKNENNGTAEAQMVLGYGYGIMLGYNFNQNIALQTEVLYNSLSQKYKDVSGERTVKLSYINVPLLFRYNTDITKPINFNVVLGPQLGINTGASVSGGSSSATDTVTARIAVKPADLGFAYGAGFNFGLGPHANPSIDLGFRGVYGLLDVSSHTQTTTTRDFYILDRSHVKTYAGLVGLTYRF